MISSPRSYLPTILSTSLVALWLTGCNITGDPYTPPDEQDMDSALVDMYAGEGAEEMAPGCIEDLCGVCDFDPTNDCVQDCEGVFGGSATEDMCGTCDDDPTNDCSQDCAGDWGGEAREDNCGTCDADPSNDCDSDCNGQPGGPASKDMCGVCDDDPTNDCEQDCNGDWGGEAAIDPCGECAGGRSGTIACELLEIQPQADTYIELNRTSIYGNDPNLLLGDNKFQIFLRFNLSSLPADAQLHEVEVVLVADDGDLNGGQGRFQAYYVTDDSWTEQINSLSAPSPGVVALGSFLLDFDGSQPEVTVRLKNNSLTQTVRNESDGALSIALQGGASYGRFFSSEYNDASKRPKLRILYFP